MNISFNRIHIHHFMSFDDATVEFKDKGYCLIKGVNKNPKDAARSNGSGKSTIFSAISYALVGETIQGLKSNLSNIYFDDGFYIELDFDCDNKNYKIIRSKDDRTLGTNLKIFIDNIDKSGKGLRESEALLNTYLPDLTKELIGSVILLGQGLPTRFTSNTPSGRKEVLEYLSKSDFMIQDLKDRIEKRITELNNKKRTLEDTLLEANTKKDIYTNQLNDKYILRDSFNQQIDYDKVINEKELEYNSLKEKVDNETELSRKYASDKDELNKTILNESLAKQNKLDNLLKQFVDYNNEIIEEKNKYILEYKQLDAEINKLKSITDICPTCGQKIPGAIKPDTTNQELKLKDLKEKLDKVLLEESDNKESYNEAVKMVNKIFEQNTDTSTTKIKEIDKLSESLNLQLKKDTDNLNILVQELNKLKSDKDTANKKRDELLKEIASLEQLLMKLQLDNQENTVKLSSLQSHIEAVNKMNTLIKRDFRGILLQDIIKYIDLRAKDYCSKIFNTNELDFKLDGNNIDISFCNKNYENLSGGEKQRVDLITQFAIRDMMCKRLNFSSNILVLDEITDNLDPVSCDKVINFITNELSSIESVFIISHHSDELSIPCDSEICVEKDLNGVSRII